MECNAVKYVSFYRPIFTDLQKIILGSILITDSTVSCKIFTANKRSVILFCLLWIKQ